MAENQSYALWIIPEGQAYSLTNGYIARLSAAYGLPQFEPHVTVLGGIRTPKRSEMRRLVEGLSPFRIRLARKVEYRDAYFRCLLLPAEKTTALSEIFLRTCEIFDREKEDYFPHLSLAYGDLPVETKLQMIRELGAIPEVEFDVRAISLVYASTAKPISSWQAVERFPLG